MAEHNRQVKGENRGRTARRIGIGLVVLVFLGLGWTIVRPSAVPADLVTLERGAMEVTLDEEGETRVRDRFVVSAPVMGRVLRIELEPGDPVIAGETILATFQPVAPVLLDARAEAEARARVRAARAGLGRAEAERQRIRAELEFAERDLKRQERLSEDQVVAAERLDLARLEEKRAGEALDAADFAVRAAKHELEMAEASLMQATGEASGERPLTLTSPVDGVVLSRIRWSEAVVPAGEPLLEVADPEKLEIVSDFLSTDAVKIRPGQDVWVEQWGGDRPLNGRVRRVEPSGFTKISALGVEEQRVNVIIDLEDPRTDWSSLGDGFRVEVRVIVWQEDGVTLVPTGALFRHQTGVGSTGSEPRGSGEGGWAVFKVEAGVARLTPVQIEQRNRLVAKVASGLAEGEEVIVHPSDGIQDGVKVEPRAGASGG